MRYARFLPIPGAGKSRCTQTVSSPAKTGLPGRKSSHFELVLCWRGLSGSSEAVLTKKNGIFPFFFPLFSLFFKNSPTYLYPKICLLNGYIPIYMCLIMWKRTRGAGYFFPGRGAPNRCLQQVWKVFPTIAAASGNILTPRNGTRRWGEARGIWFPRLLHPGACPIKLRSRCAAQIPADHLSRLTIHIGNAGGPSLPVLAPYRAIAQFVVAIAAHCRVAQTYEKLTCNPMIFSHRLLAERIRTTGT